MLRFKEHLQSKEFIGVQFLRAFAATSVVVGHGIERSMLALNIENKGLMDYAWQLDHFGVGLFFAISGFIMATSLGRKGASRDFTFSSATHESYIFLLRRICRVVPIYWIATIIAVISKYLFTTHTDLTVKNFLMSIFFIPYQNDVGKYFPIHGVGWTLNFEFAFYIFFALSFILSPKHVCAICAALLFCLAASSNWGGSFYQSPILYYFCVGIAVWYASKMLHSEVKLNILAVYSCAVALPIICYLLSGSYDTMSHLAFTFIFLFIGVRSWPEKITGTNKLLSDIGDSSYSLYLLHVFVLFFIEAILKHLHIGFTLFASLNIILGVIVSSTAAILMFRTVEIPLQSWFLSKLLKPAEPKNTALSH